MANEIAVATSGSATARKVGFQPRQCEAHKTNGEQCKANALVGLKVCWFHGGAGKGARKKAIERQVTHAAEAMAFVYGAPLDGISPEEALTDELSRTAGHVAWLQEQIATADPTFFVKGLWLSHRQSGHVKPEEVDDFSWNAAGALWVELYMKERDHLVKVSATAISAGLEERKVLLAERMVAQIGEAVTAMLEELGHDPTDPEVRAVAYRAISHASGQSIA